jgi:hypothetical protein
VAVSATFVVTSTDSVCSDGCSGSELPDEYFRAGAWVQIQPASVPREVDVALCVDAESAPDTILQAFNGEGSCCLGEPLACHRQYPGAHTCPLPPSCCLCYVRLKPEPSADDCSNLQLIACSEFVPDGAVAFIAVLVMATPVGFHNPT